MIILVQQNLNFEHPFDCYKAYKLLTKMLHPKQRGNIAREDLRVVREKQNENLIPFVSTFNPPNPEMFNTIRQNLPILHEDETMKEIMQNYPIIKS